VVNHEPIRKIGSFFFGIRALCLGGGAAQETVNEKSAESDDSDSENRGRSGVTGMKPETEGIEGTHDRGWLSFVFVAVKRPFWLVSSAQDICEQWLYAFDGPILRVRG
jgi:hypothetical protein